MAKSQAEKAQSRERILSVASRRFRDAGLEGIGVAELMAEAGLTHGGFYGHFDSRDARVTAALARALEENEAEKDKTERHGRAGLIDYVEGYLTPEHRDGPGTGCAVGALVGDVARADDDTRALFSTRFARYLAWVEALLERHGQQGREEAAFVLSTLVGALTLSRAVSDPELSKLILSGARKQIKAHIKALPAPGQA